MTGSDAPRACPAARFPWPGLWSRRDLLRVGSIGIAATVLPGLRAAAEPARSDRLQPVPDQGSTGTGAADIPVRPPTARSVIFLWMAGGVTHIDSFDPKPAAPQEIRGTLTAIDTCLPGVQFCETMPCLAQVADRLALVRSFSHDSHDHFLSQAYALSGRKVPMTQIMTEPNIGSIVSHLHGPRAGLPGYIAVPGVARPGPPPHNLFVGGWLGEQHAPFAVGGEPDVLDFTQGPLVPETADIEAELHVEALELPDDVDALRFNRRRTLRAQLDRMLRDADRDHPDHAAGRARAAHATAAMEGHYTSALHLLTAPETRAAFDLAREPDRMRERYGRTKIGLRCLLARRLVEAGARYVMVDYGYDPDYGNLWDNHNAPTQNHPPICEMVKRPYHLVGIDRAFAALITDLEERGLLAETLVVFMTEFGRTPQINANGGRDHWGAAGSVFFAGGGARGGQVIGATDARAAYPTARSYTPGDVAATIYRAIGVDPHALLYDRERRPLPVLPEGEPIPGVLA